jgi:hypothetical protein
VHAADPVTVTKVEYVTLDGYLLTAVEASMGFANVWGNGNMFTALAHDSRWLDTCKAQLDGIRTVYTDWLATHPAASAPQTLPAASPKAAGQ